MHIYFSASSYYLLSFASKHLPHLPVLELPQLFKADSNLLSLSAENTTLEHVCSGVVLLVNEAQGNIRGSHLWNVHIRGSRIFLTAFEATTSTHLHVLNASLLPSCSQTVASPNKKWFRYSLDDCFHDKESWAVYGHWRNWINSNGEVCFVYQYLDEFEFVLYGATRNVHTSAEIWFISLWL